MYNNNIHYTMSIKYIYAMFHGSMKSSMANVEGHVAMINTMTAN